jgi:uncharacterized LabA/DUF88 family protein
MYFKDTERLALFIDGANLYATAKALGFDVDYKKLLGFFRNKSHVTQARYYTAGMAGQDYRAAQIIGDWLEYNGYTWMRDSGVRNSGAIPPDGLDRRREPKCIDVELAVDVLALAPSIDHVVLFTGDGDFCALVSAVQAMGLRVSVVSSALTQPSRIDDDLRRQADQFIDLVELQTAIQNYRPAMRRRRLVVDPEPRTRPGQIRYAWPA